MRHPLRVTARLDVSTVALTSQPSPLPTRQNFFYAKKKSRSDFFWRRPLRVTAVAASHTSEKNLRQKKSRSDFFFGVDRCASQLSPLPTGPRTSQLSPLPTPQKKFYAKKKSRSDFCLASTVARHSWLGRIDRNFFRICFVFLFVIFFVNFS